MSSAKRKNLILKFWEQMYPIEGIVQKMQGTTTFKEVCHVVYTHLKEQKDKQ